MKAWAASLLLVFASTVPAAAEAVDVKYVGRVDLAEFQCEPISRSSFINRVCYDQETERLVIQLRATYYQYCSVPPDLVADLSAAHSMGRYYNQNIKSSAVDGRYDCE
jgi:hypothetical protein